MQTISKDAMVENQPKSSKVESKNSTDSSPNTSGSSNGAPGCGYLGCHTPGCSGSLTSTEDYRYYIWEYLKNNLTDSNGASISDIHVAAIMGNMSVESGFDPTNAQDEYGWPEKHNPEYMKIYDVDDSIGWGLIQWTYQSRKQGLLDYAGDVNLVGNMDIQLEFLIYELTDPSSEFNGKYQTFLTITDLNEATKYFLDNIEKAAVSHLDWREQAAQAALDDYAKG